MDGEIGPLQVRTPIGEIAALIGADITILFITQDQQFTQVRPRFNPSHRSYPTTLRMRAAMDTAKIASVTQTTTVTS